MPNSTLSLTEEAITRLKNVLETQQAPEGALRVYVTPGGCSGFSYGMSLEAEPADDDEIVEQAGVKVVVDPFSLQYL
ncbi:MAG TPA: iron-sulfur cluster assembly accessory protein, partial [Chloroflexota bacterium]|nr:iron-sulfur cluster assembly accessory protein [Chloroflexota bacterium]